MFSRFRLLIPAFVILGLIGWFALKTGDEVPSDAGTSRTEVAGFPNEYAAYAHLIRTREGDAGPRYPMGYRLSALENARAARKTTAAPLPWIERGPVNAPGRTRAVAVDPADATGTTWLVGSVGGGLWRTTSAGGDWTPIAADLPNLAISWIQFAPSNPDIVYAGTGEGYFNVDAVAGAGVLKSTDHGVTWSVLPATGSDPAFRFVNRLVVSHDDPNVVVAATNAGIFRTADGGSTWNVASDVGFVTQVIADPSDFNRLFAAASGSGVYRSLDAGLSWIKINTAPFDSGVVSGNRIELAIAPTDPNRVYAAVEGSQLFVSRNGGTDWLPVSESNALNEVDWMGGQGWYDNAISVHPFSPDTFFVGGVEGFRMHLLQGTETVFRPSNFVEDNTGDFLSFVNFGAGFFDGRLATGLEEEALNLAEEDLVTVEIRFGPGKGQKAHRFIPPDGPGIPLDTYPYASYVDVPFEVWDIDNNRQLMVSFRDRLNDGVFDLQLRDDLNMPREYVFVHAIPYNASAPDPGVSASGGLVQKMMYFFWPHLTDGGTWNPTSLPLSTFRIEVATFEAQLRETSPFAPGSTVHVDHHLFLMLPDDKATNAFRVIAANDGGVYYSENGGRSWRNVGRGLNTAQFYGVDKKHGADQYLGGTQDNGTWRSSLNPTAASSWLSILGGDGFDAGFHDGDCLPNDGDPACSAVATYQFNNIVRSVNGGTRWEDATVGMTDVGAGAGQFITSIAQSPHDPDLLFTIGASGFWRSTNFAEKWTLKAIPAEDWSFGGSGRVRVSESSPVIVWGGYEMDAVDNGGGDVVGKLHVSSNGGFAFESVPTPSIAPGRISGLSTHPDEDSTAYVLFSVFGAPKVLRTRDLGQTWEDLSGFETGSSDNGFPDVAVHDLLVMPHRPTEIWVGTEIGLVISDDDGVSWSLANNGLPAVSIWQLRAVEDQVVVATHGRGIWSVAIPAITAIEDAADLGGDLPNRFALAQNYPNPFNPSTLISYDVAAAEHVRLELFDVSGRRVALLANGLHQPGRYEVRWNAESFASGTYLYRLQAGAFSTTRSMVLVR